MTSNHSKEFNDSFKILKILLLLVLTACNSNDKNSSVSNSQAPILTHTIESTTVITPLLTLEPITSTAMSLPTPPPTLEPSPLLTTIKAELLATDCSPPCVFDVVPGQTEADEVPVILESLKEEGIVQDFSLIEHPSATSYAVFFPSYPLSIDFQIDEDKNIVLAVRFGTGNRVITFGDIVNRFGVPTLVIPFRADSFESLIFEYPDEHIRVQVRTDFLGEDYLPISLDMTIINLVYESPEVSQARLSELSTRVMWEGYKSFDYYYMVYDQLKEKESN